MVWNYRSMAKDYKALIYSSLLNFYFTFKDSDMNNLWFNEILCLFWLENVED